MAIVLGIAATVGAALVIPYQFAIMPEAIAQLRARSPIPLPALLALQLVQGAVLLWLCAWIGLAAGHRVGLDAPLLRALVYRTPLPADRRTRDFRSAIVWGVMATALVIAATLAAAPYMPHARHGGHGPSPWLGLLGSFYGGISEEVQLRLLLMTGIAWIIAAVKSWRAPAIPGWVYWTAIVAAAFLFAAGHLPTAIRALGAGPVVIARTLAANFPAGVIFGWMYWKRGLEHAMAAHFTADIGLHVLTPLVFTSL